MTLDDIAAETETVTTEQIDDDHERLAEDSAADDLQQRQMDEYDGGWEVGS